MPDLFVANDTPKNIVSEKPVEPATKQKNGMQFHLFSSFYEMPAGMRFESQTDDETILLFMRRHLITNVPWIFGTLVLLVFPIILSQLFSSSGSPITLPANLSIILLFFYYLGVFAYTLVNFITWFYNITILTDKRIVDIDFSEIVYHDVAQTKLSLLEDVNYTQTGFIRSFFNYGDVFAQTAGGKENIEALAVPKPQTAVQLIADRIGEGDISG